MSLTKPQRRWLDWLTERGGVGILDRYGRVVARGEAAPATCTTVWLRLVAEGLVTGDNGVVRITGRGALPAARPSVQAPNAPITFASLLKETVNAHTQRTR